VQHHGSYVITGGGQECPPIGSRRIDMLFLNQVYVPGILYEHIRVFHIVTGLLLTAVTGWWAFILVVQVFYAIWVAFERNDLRKGSTI